MPVAASDTIPASEYDGEACADLEARLGVPRLALYARVGSTQDLAHALAAAGAPAGTLVLADAQSSGRGRQGSVWHSAPGEGIWMTLLERPGDPSAVEVLSLRLGLAAARVLDRWTEEPVQLKWPNDLLLAGGKLAGILVEARWREQRVDWLAIGFGLNLRPPRELPAARGLRSGSDRVEVLASLVPALRAGAAEVGPLREAELEEYRRRDGARGRRCVQPVQGRVEGITAAGELLVATDTGVARVRAGSLVLQEDSC